MTLPEGSSTNRPPDPIVLGADGPELRFPADVLELLWPAAEAWMAEHERRGGISKLRRCAPWLAAWSRIVTERHPGRFAGEHDDGDGDGEPSRSPHGWINSDDTAERLGCTPQHVGRLAARGEFDVGTVKAWQPGGRGTPWTIPTAGVDAYLARRDLT